MNLGIGELVVIFGIVVVCAFAATMLAGVGLAISRRRTGVVTTPLDILQARYARGEISRDQFEEMKRDIS